MRILAVVILYNPDSKLLLKNLHGIAPFVDHILLWQNSEVDHSTISGIPYPEKFEWAGNCENKGISTALNYAWDYAVNNSYDYLLTMDQDSVFIGFDNYLSNIVGSDQPSGIYGPGVNWMAFAGTLRNFDFPITPATRFPLLIPILI